MRLLFILKHWNELLDMAQRQQQTIRMQRRAILELHRQQRDMATAWLISMESPEIDLRDDVSEMVSALSDKIAQLEEHSA
jgi:hypothetical protein